jgi:CDP-glycerol glycerophosphotransferase
MVVFEAFMSHSYSCSPKAIYEKMLNDPEFKDYTFVWSFRDPAKYQHLANERTSIVRFQSLEYYRAYATAKYWVVNGWVPLNVHKRRGQIMLQTWHGAMLKRLRNDIIPSNKHATTSYDESVRLGMLDARRYDYFISTAKFFNDKIISAFGLKQLEKENIIIETGYPRNDYLFHYTKKDVDKTRKELGLPKGKKVLLYTPTWRDDQHDGKRFTYKTAADFDYLKKKLASDYVILFRAHYNVAKNFDFAKYEGFIYDVSSIDDVNELYVASDALMTDYSSTFFDFADLKRPILFFMYDYEHYAKELHGLYLELDELPGAVVKTEKEVVAALNDLKAYEKKYASRYKAFNEKFTYIDDGNATDRVIEKVFK